MRSLLTLITLFLLFDFCGYAQKDNPTSANINPCADYWEKSYQHPYLEEGDLLWEEGTYNRAMHLYQAAATEFKKRKNWKGFIKVQNRIGRKLIENRSDSAISILENNLSVIREYLSNDSVELAEVYLQMGRYYDLIGGNPAKSFEFHNQSLSIKIELFGEEHIDVARSYRNIGELYRFSFSNRYQDAITSLNKSIDIMVALGCEDLNEVGLSYYYMASSYRMLDDHEKAIIYAQKALSVYQNNESGTLNEKSNCYSLLANIYLNRGDLLKSKYHIEVAIKMLSGQPSLTLAQQRNLANYLNTLAVVYNNQKEYDSAYFFYRKSLVYYRNIPGSDRSIALISQNIGNIYAILAQYDSAYNYLMDAIEITRKIDGKKSFNTSSTLRFIGDLFQEMNHLDSALNYYQQAVVAGANENFGSYQPFQNPGPESFTFDGSLIRALIEKGALLQNIYKRNHNFKYLEHSLATLITAIELMDRNQDLYELEGSTLLMAGSFYRVFEVAVDVCFTLYGVTARQKYIETAFMVIEKSKARLLFDSFSDLRQKQLVGVPDSVLEVENNIKAELLKYSQELQKENNKSPVQEATIDQLNEKVFQATVALESFYQALESQYPSYTSVVKSELSDLNSIQKKLTENNSVLLDYFWGDSALYSLVIEPDKVQLFKQSITPVEKMVRRYLEHLLDGPQFANQNALFTEFTENAFDLYKSLFKGVDSVRQTLIIAPDGLLRFIPIEGLVLERPKTNTNSYNQLKYVLHLFSTSYVYSANLWAMKPDRKPGRLTVLGFSHSSHEKQEFDSIELPGTAEEIEVLKSQIDGSFFSGLNATKQQFINQAPNFDIIHLAIHGISDTISHLNNRLLFRSPEDITQTVPLYTHELYNLRLKSKLAVLSACESGIGQNFRGEGVYSMSRAFSYSGCPTTVMSLWKISDKTTPAILKGFYNQISKGNSIDQALRQAKLDYIADNPGSKSHPGLWAALVVHGDTSPLAKSNYVLLITVVVVLVILMGILLYRNRLERI